MFVRVLYRSKVRTAVLLTVIVAAAVVLLIRPEAAASGVSRGLSICGTVLIPSLFPFLVLSGFVARSGVALAVGRRLGGITRVLFGLPGECAVGIILAFIGGYPAGATAVNELLRSERINRDQARQMLQFCVCGGPGFVIGTVGGILMNSVAFGVLVYVATILAAIVLGVVSAPCGTRSIHTPCVFSSSKGSPLTAFVDAVSGGCYALLTTCGFLVFFSAALSVTDSFLSADQRVLSVVLSCLAEVSCGCVSASTLWLIAPPLLGFTVGFGGLSVQCQIAATLRTTGVITPRFWLFRLAHGGLTAVFTVVLLRFIPITLPVFGALSSQSVQPFAGSVGLSVLLLMVCGIWLVVVDNHRQVSYNKKRT